jgi:hypothetical protein
MGVQCTAMPTAATSTTTMRIVSCGSSAIIKRVALLREAAVNASLPRCGGILCSRLMDRGQLMLRCSGNR